MTLLIENQYFGTVNYYKMLFQYTYTNIEQCEFYQKLSFRNRCMVPGANGVIQLSVPLENGRNQRSLIKEVKIAYKDNWVLQHCRSLDACYNRAPFFEFYRDELFELLETRPIFLFDLNLSLMNWVLKKLKANLDIQLTKVYDPNPPIEVFDARNIIVPKNQDTYSNFINYTQVFEDRIGFKPNMSILDLLFCVGPNRAFHLLKSNEISN
ncbi:MAG: WbqC family protein [Sediminibacterium sp.]|nr:WbqC family protein [Sediminibacterium sp.]